jgi:hypothetical protein
MQRTSSTCNSVNMYTFSKLMPAILMLPTFIPMFSHLFIRSIFFFFYLADPLLRFPLVFCCVLLSVFRLSAVLPYYYTLIRFFSVIVWLSFMIAPWVALAQWGAIPFPTPAGLWPGGGILAEVLGVGWRWWVVFGEGFGAG